MTASVRGDLSTNSQKMAEATDFDDTLAALDGDSTGMHRTGQTKPHSPVPVNENTSVSAMLDNFLSALQDQTGIQRNDIEHIVTDQITPIMNKGSGYTPRCSASVSIQHSFASYHSQKNQSLTQTGSSLGSRFLDSIEKMLLNEKTTSSPLPQFQYVQQKPIDISSKYSAPSRVATPLAAVTSDQFHNSPKLDHMRGNSTAGIVHGDGGSMQELSVITISSPHQDVFDSCEKRGLNKEFQRPHLSLSTDVVGHSGVISQGNPLNSDATLHTMQQSRRMPSHNVLSPTPESQFASPTISSIPPHSHYWQLNDSGSGFFPKSLKKSTPMSTEAPQQLQRPNQFHNDQRFTETTITQEVSSFRNTYENISPISNSPVADEVISNNQRNDNRPDEVNLATEMSQQLPVSSNSLPNDITISKAEAVKRLLIRNQSIPKHDSGQLGAKYRGSGILDYDNRFLDYGAINCEPMIHAKTKATDFHKNVEKTPVTSEPTNMFLTRTKHTKACTDPSLYASIQEVAALRKSFLAVENSLYNQGQIPASNCSKKSVTAVWSKKTMSAQKSDSKSVAKSYKALNHIEILKINEKQSVIPRGMNSCGHDFSNTRTNAVNTNVTNSATHTKSTLTAYSFPVNVAKLCPCSSDCCMLSSHASYSQKSEFSNSEAGRSKTSQELKSCPSLKCNWTTSPKVAGFPVQFPSPDVYSHPPPYLSSSLGLADNMSQNLHEDVPSKIYAGAINLLEKPINVEAQNFSGPFYTRCTGCLDFDPALSDISQCHTEATRVHSLPSSDVSSSWFSSNAATNIGCKVVSSRCGTPAPISVNIMQCMPTCQLSIRMPNPNNENFLPSSFERSQFSEITRNTFVSSSALDSLVPLCCMSAESPTLQPFLEEDMREENHTTTVPCCFGSLPINRNAIAVSTMSSSSRCGNASASENFEQTNSHEHMSTPSFSGIVLPSMASVHHCHQGLALTNKDIFGASNPPVKPIGYCSEQTCGITNIDTTDSYITDLSRPRSSSSGVTAETQVNTKTANIPSSFLTSVKEKVYCGPKKNRILGKYCRQLQPSVTKTVQCITTALTSEKLVEHKDGLHDLGKAGYKHFPAKDSFSRNSTVKQSQPSSSFVNVQSTSVEKTMETKPSSSFLKTSTYKHDNNNLNENDDVKQNIFSLFDSLIQEASQSAADRLKTDCKPKKYENNIKSPIPEVITVSTSIANLCTTVAAIATAAISQPVAESEMTKIAENSKHPCIAEKITALEAKPISIQTSLLLPLTTVSVTSPSKIAETCEKYRIETKQTSSQFPCKRHKGSETTDCSKVIHTVGNFGADDSFPDDCHQNESISMSLERPQDALGNNIEMRTKLCGDSTPDAVTVHQTCLPEQSAGLKLRITAFRSFRGKVIYKSSLMGDLLRDSLSTNYGYSYRKKHKRRHKNGKHQYGHRSVPNVNVISPLPKSSVLKKVESSQGKQNQMSSDFSDNSRQSSSDKTAGNITSSCTAKLKWKKLKLSLPHSSTSTTTLDTCSSTTDKPSDTVAAQEIQGEKLFNPKTKNFQNVSSQNNKNSSLVLPMTVSEKASVHIDCEVTHSADHVDDETAPVNLVVSRTTAIENAETAVTVSPIIVPILCNTKLDEPSVKKTEASIVPKTTMSGNHLPIKTSGTVINKSFLPRVILKRLAPSYSLDNTTAFTVTSCGVQASSVPTTEVKSTPTKTTAVHQRRRPVSSKKAVVVLNRLPASVFS